MPIDEDTKVFDVARPTQARPDTTSRPIIVGHQPQTSDPMVKDETLTMSTQDPTPIRVAMDDDEDTTPQEIAVNGTSESGAVDTDNSDENPSIAPQRPEDFESLAGETTETPAQESTEQEMPQQDKALPNEPAPGYGQPVSEETPPPDSSSDQYASNSPAPEPEAPAGTDHPDHQPNGDDDHHDLPPLQMAHGAGPKKRGSKNVLLVLVSLIVLIIVAYLAIDAGVFGSNINLPFHIFKHQNSNNSTPPPVPVAKTTAPVDLNVPAGFTAYKLSGTNLSFDYPTSWGAPAVKTDPGFSKLGGANKSDGTYAYLVDFPSNKDVEVAFTSSKYLPAKHAPLYYDYLQWCIGTNDGKFYKQRMLTTDNAGVETPATIVCDQGPLDNATKIDSQTIEEKAKFNSGSGPSAQGMVLIFDLYTKNLDDQDYVVAHVKDSAMTKTNGDNIKQLLASIKSSGSSSGSTSSNSSSSASSSGAASSNPATTPPSSNP